jgi:transcriptional regulator with XRE-family HTH domain
VSCLTVPTARERVGPGETEFESGPTTGQVPGECRAEFRALTANPVYWTMKSTMQDLASDLNQRIAARVRELRASSGLSLEALAGRAGVSRSMISLIERGECSPTAVVLDKLAAGLNVPLASLFETSTDSSRAPSGPVSRRAEQPQWRDPASGYLRRSVSPAGMSQPMQITEVHFPPGGRVAFETGPRETPVDQQIWVLAGAIDITIGSDRHSLRKGDCLAMQVDGPTMFHNPTSKPARYAVVTAGESRARKR